MKRKKIYIITAAVLAMAGGGTAYYYINANATEKEAVQYEEIMMEHGDLPLEFTGEGTTAISTTNQKLEFDPSVVELEVAEVYVEANDTVSAGDALFKLTEESYQNALAYYEEEVADAEKEKTKAKQEYTAGKTEAENTLKAADSKAATAETSYQAKIAALDQAVTDAQTAITDAQNQITAYQSNIDNNTYYTDAQIDEKKEALSRAKDDTKIKKSSYKEAKTSYEEQKSNIDTEITELQKLITESADLAADGENITNKVTQLAADNAALGELQKTLEQAETEYEAAQETQEKAQQEYDNAKQSYQQNLNEAATKKAELEEGLTSLQVTYDEAVRKAETERVDLKNEYDKSVLEGSTAQTEYDTTVGTLQSAVDEAADALEDLQAQQTALLACSNGTITASSDGTIASVGYEAGNILSKDIPAVIYNDSSKVMISVEVDQADISKIKVGDTTSVTISDIRGGDLEGTISEIASAATAGASRSNITYAVTVTMDNTEGNLSAGVSAGVIFNYGTLSEVDYIRTDALHKIDGSSAKVKQYDANGEVQEVEIIIGESTDNYTVVTEGLTTEDICLIEAGGEK